MARAKSFEVTHREIGSRTVVVVREAGGGPVGFFLHTPAGAVEPVELGQLEQDLTPEEWADLKQYVDWRDIDEQLAEQHALAAELDQQFLDSA